MAYEDDDEDYQPDVIDEPDVPDVPDVPDEPEPPPEPEEPPEPEAEAPEAARAAPADAEEETFEPWTPPEASAAEAAPDEAEADIKLPGQYAAVDTGTKSDAGGAPPKKAAEAEEETFKPWKPDTKADADEEKFTRYDPNKPEAEGTLMTIGRKLLHYAAPTAAAIGTGVVTAPAGPWVSIPAGIAAFMGVHAAQEKGLEVAGISDAEQQRINAEANPKSDIAADVIAAAIPFGVGTKAALGQRALGAGIGTVLEGYGQAREGHFDPTRLAIGAATGAVFNQPRAGTLAFERMVGAQAGRVTGRPDLYPPPGAEPAPPGAVKGGEPAVPAPPERQLGLEPAPNVTAPDSTGVTSRPAMPDTGGVAKEAVPPPGAPHDRQGPENYGKEASAREPGGGMNVGEMDPTIAETFKSRPAAGETASQAAPQAAPQATSQAAARPEEMVQGPVPRTQQEGGAGNTFTVTDPAFARGQTANVQVERNPNTGVVEAIRANDQRHVVPTVYRGQPPEEIIARMFGSHPYRAQPDVSQVRPAAAPGEPVRRTGTPAPARELPATERATPPPPAVAATPPVEALATAARNAGEAIRGSGRGGARLPGFTPSAPPPSSAQAAILARIAPSKSSLLSRLPTTPAAVKTAWRQVYTAVKNDLDPLQQFTKTLAQGRSLATEADPYKLARLTRGSWGKVEQMLTHGTYDFNTGKNNGKSLQNALKPVANDMDRFTAYATSKRAIELEGRGIASGMPIADARTVVAQGAKQYEPVFRELVSYQGRVLDYLQKSGILSAGDVAKMRAKNQEFVPYYRLVDPGKELGVHAGLQVKDPIFGIKGSQREVLNPIDSIIRNTHVFVSLAERNRALQALEDLASSHPQGNKLMEPVQKTHPVNVTSDEINRFIQQHGVSGTVADNMTIFRPNAFRPNPDEIRLFRDGKSKIYKVEKPVAEAVNTLDRDSLNMLTRVLAAPARLLRAGATLAPEFIVRNPVRDQFSALAFSKHGYLPVYDMVRGLGHLLKKDDVFQSWLKSGGANATLVALDRKVIGMNPTDFASQVKNVIKSPIEALRTASELMENATRLGEFNRAIEKGVSPAAAAFSSREVTLDFARIGAKTKAVNAMIPFFNAQVEGIDRAARAFRDNPTGTLTKMGLSITLPSVLLWFANKDDERVRELPQWQKDLFWIVATDKWVPLTADDRAGFPEDVSKLKNTIRQAPDGSWQRNAGTLWKIPKPFELGVLFGSVPERALDAFFTTHPNAFKNLDKTVIQGLMPSFIPQAVLPSLEQWANKSFFLDRPLLTAKQEKLPPAQQVAPFTSETAKVAGSVIRSVLGDKSSFGSPIMIDNYIRQWSGGLGQYVVKGIDTALKTGQDRPPAPTAATADLPGIKAFVARFPGSDAQSIKDFYDERKDRQTEQAGIKAQMKLEPEAAAARMEKSNRYTGDRVAKILQADRDAVNRIMEDRKMSPDDKRAAIDLTYLIMIEHAKLGMKTFEQTKRKQP